MKEYPYWWETVPGPGSDGGLFGTPSVIDARAAEAVTGRVDVAIIGAGYTGLAAALRLARAGASVVVLERESVGWGASSRNGGQVLTGLKRDPRELVARFGVTRARDLFALSLTSIAELEDLIADEAIDCGYERTGHIQAACKPDHFEAFCREQALLSRVFEHHVELVAAADQEREVGTHRYHGLLLDRRSGALNPAQYARGLAVAATRAGVRVFERASVSRLSRESARWSVKTTRGSVDAGDVLVATDGYTNGVTPWLQRRFVPIGSYIIVTEPLAEADAARVLPTNRMAFDSKHFLHYFRITGDRRLLFGGRAAFSRPSEDTTRRAAEILQREMQALFPMLRGAHVEYGWGGNVAFTRDQMPHAGRLDGAYYAGGYCGHGVAMATHLGGVIARRMAGELIEHPFVDDQFPAIPFYRGTPWFLPLVGAYYRFRDLVD